VIESNRLDDAFFGIYLSRVTGCRVTRNVLRGTPRTEESSGNGIHLWSSSGVLVAENTISGHRDGLYFEFTRDTEARGNVSERNVRYGLHFMYSDNCRYVDNSFRRNGAGVAVMYTKTVAMVGNRFEDNRGSAAYGLLLKEIADPVLERNTFRGNTVGLFADGAARITASGNRFENNGWAVKLMASTEGGRFVRNEFVANTFDVSSNSRTNSTVFDHNYWSEYEGYDLDRDGAGDVPHRPVRLFSLLVEDNEPTLILLRSLFVRLLDTAERVLPSLTPETLADARPSMRPFLPRP
jgi:nitrous oxidase accessory protein